MKSGAEQIAVERKRQNEEEGWTTEHDIKEHAPGDLAKAGANYAYILPHKKFYHAPPLTWPFDHKWWKPTPGDPIRQLVKAGALIAAEIDRLQNENGPGFEDGPWAEGWEERSKNVEGDIE